jgi:hypothetical protein
VKKTILLILLVLFVNVLSALAQQPPSRSAAGLKPAATIKVTGSYRARDKTAPNSMEVQQLPGGKIKVHILALWVSSYNVENVHNGELQGIVDLIGNTATYEADHCKVIIKFTSVGAVVKQADELGDCDFGANVTASGTYRKVDRRKPQFDF